MRYLLFILCILSFQIQAQKLNPLAPAFGETLPAWAQEMYSDHPNAWSIEQGYRNWRLDHPNLKTTFTQYYKKWRRSVQSYINADGFVQAPSNAVTTEFQNRIQTLKTGATAGKELPNWTCMGPFETFNTNTGPAPSAKSSQANIYCIDQSPSNPDIVYCGTEGSEIFKSTDRGLNWVCVSRNVELYSPTALEVHPTNPDTVLVGDGGTIRKSNNGGTDWDIVLSVNDLSVNEIKISPINPSLVLAATYKGLYRSTDGGLNWTKLTTVACYDIEWKTDDPTTAFLVQNDPVAKISRFYKSTDSGLTWTLKSDGWFFSDAPGVNNEGSRLAVTNADPNRIYAVLIGEAKTDDSGFIGIYRSDDAGETWILPNPPAGGPWLEDTHPNMATINRTGGYHQGFYNLGFDASDTNPDEVMAGFLNLWISTDGATTFDCMGGYCGNSFNYVHPDCQEIEINNQDLWMTSDGGIEYSNDFFQTHYARNRGITSVDFWGFATGWNDDLFVGGRYHNGNTAWYEDWAAGECLSLGGGEAPTGYVNPGPGLKAYFSDLGSLVLPPVQNGFTQYSNFGKYPNESYVDSESGEMEWDPRSWNTFYITKENKIWKTKDGGANWSILKEFGASVGAQTTSLEISRSNPNKMYVFQRAAYYWDPGMLWKSSDGGNTWIQLTMPPGNARRMHIALSPEDENVLWIAYPDGDNGQKVYSSTNGGQSWINITGANLNGEHVSGLLHQGGTNGALYLGTYRTIWYRDNAMNDWTPYNEGLPRSVATCIMRPFYRDGKLRLGAYSKGVWEVPFFAPSRPVAQPMVIKQITDCPADTLQFDDYSMLDHAGATWSWQFPGGSPATSTLRNPRVVYQVAGEYDVILTVTNPQGSSTKIVENMVKVENAIVNEGPIINDFSGGLGDLTIINPDNGITWTPINLTTCDPEGDTAYYVDNFNYSTYGQDEIALPINLDLTQVVDPILKFRVSYAPYYDVNAFIDSLKVLISNDCGSSFKTIFRSGGEALSTTTDGIGPNGLYETAPYAPRNCNEWREINLDLSAFEGQYVTIKILNQSGYGNNMYLDDLALIGDFMVSTQVPENSTSLSLQPNPTHGQTFVKGHSIQAEHLVFTLYNVTGQRIWDRAQNFTTGTWEVLIPTGSLPSGIYFVNVMNDSGWQWIRKVIKE